MRIMIRGVLLTAVVLAAMPAYASSLGYLTLYEQGVNWSQNIAVHSPNPTIGNITAQAGVYILKVNKDAAASGLGVDIYNAAATNSYTFGAFCADIRQYSNSAPGHQFDVYNASDMFDAATAARLRKLFYYIMPLSGRTLGPNPLNWNSTTAPSFQLAVWEIISDSTMDLSNGVGNFYVRSSPISLATATGWLNSLDAYQDPATLGDPDYHQPLVLYNATYQDYAFWDPNIGTTQPVPEPLTMIGAFLGISSLGAYIRRRTKTA